MPLVGHAAPPYSGTIFLDPRIITELDPTVFGNIVYAGTGPRLMFDRRVNAFVTYTAFLFNATFTDDRSIEVQVNPEFGSAAAAAIEAEKYARVIGQLPAALRVDVRTVWIHRGVQPFGGGNRNLLIHTDQADLYVASGILEETLVHEASHTSLDSAHANSTGWRAAQVADVEFISTYARDNPTREDIAESFLPYLAVRYRRDRISDVLAATIASTIPNRLQYFDAQAFNLFPFSCVYSISPSSRTIEAAAGTGSVSVTTTAGCPWTLTSNASWITATGGASGTGSGSVSYAWAANTLQGQRIGTLTVAGLNLTVTQQRAAARVPFDFDGDGRADVAVWRPDSGMWFWLTSGTGFDSGAAGAKAWGAPTDKPMGGDLDGDGRKDLIVWRPSNGTWYWLTSSTGYDYANQGSKQWGASTDIPLVADVDGDGLDDLVIWRPSTGTWYWLTSSSGYSYASGGGIQWGNLSLGDQPVLGDYDGDGRADLGVWRASTGTWYWLTSSSNYSYASAYGIQWGNQSLGDTVLTGDIEGDGRTDLILWRPTDGTWYWLLSSTNYSYSGQGGKQWGNHSLGDKPMLGDFDGDGRADLTVWRSSTGTWYWLTSSSGYSYASAIGRQWGAPTDIPMIR